MINERMIKKYCREDPSLIENYAEAVAAEEKWDCHHRMETHDRKGRPRKIHFSQRELIAYGVYYHRPAWELIFLTRAEHIRLHNMGENNNMFGKKHSDETKKKISEANKGLHAGEKSPWFGKHHTEETKKKISEAQKAEKNHNYGKPSAMLGKKHSDATKQKMSEARKKYWERRRKENGV